MSISFEGEQHKIVHTGSRKRFSAYIFMLWPDHMKLIYHYYDEMNFINTMDYLEKLMKHVRKVNGKDWYSSGIMPHSI